MDRFQKFKVQKAVALIVVILSVAACNQQTRFQCGLLSLMAIADSRHIVLNYEALIDEAKLNRGSISFSELQRIGLSNKLRFVGRMYSIEQLVELRPIGIAELRVDHFVAVLQVRDQTLIVADRNDPDSNEVETWSIARFEDNWTGRFLELSQ
jgi:ABC-type bacteriocin/lantibiotic exporter with double-glycine peptidase domain